jgi:uncharacterized protein (DUF1800 family)
MTRPDIAEIRFGYGMGPRHAARDGRGHLAALDRADAVARRFPVTPLADILSMGREFRDANRAQRDGVAGAEARYERARTALREAGGRGVRSAFARIAEGEAPLRERLTWFWADHFSAVPGNLLSRAATPSYVDEAIRPHVAGRFAEMLKAVIRHPAMLFSLDQQASVGPNSRIGQRSGRGLNENLARELLELHTLGVGEAYTQADVQQVAELLTGLSLDPERGFRFRPAAAEPGAETILGETYGGPGRARLADIDGLLEDLANRPETARHIARKLAVHFVADRPDDALVGALEATYRETGGDLGVVTEALVMHPAAASTQLRKVKTPMEFVASTMVAIGARGTDVQDMRARDLMRFLLRPLSAMGQPFLSPPGPDGWPEAPEHWITPQGLATRISWAVAVADELGPELPDPRAFLDTTLGAVAGDDLRFAVAAAETRSEGVALTLASAEFNRR